MIHQEIVVAETQATLEDRSLPSVGCEMPWGSNGQGRQASFKQCSVGAGAKGEGESGGRDSAGVGEHGRGARAPVGDPRRAEVENGAGKGGHLGGTAQNYAHSESAKIKRRNGNTMPWISLPASTDHPTAGRIRELPTLLLSRLRTHKAHPRLCRITVQFNSFEASL